MKPLTLAILALLAGCATQQDGEPFCVKFVDGKPVAFVFMGSRDQMRTFDHGKTPLFPQRKKPGLTTPSSGLTSLTR